MNNTVLFTNDVELTSIVNNTQSIHTGQLVQTRGLPLILDLYAKYGFRCTFFITADFAKAFPSAVRTIKSEGHEIGSHGAAHGHEDAFDRMSYLEQYNNLILSKKILEDIIGDEVISFRAPALRTNSNTPKALMQAGYKIDSSVASQRFDFLFSFGSKEKLSWLTAPRSPYRCSEESLSMKGEFGIFEIPLISWLYPYICTTLRISPFFTKVVRKLLDIETRWFTRYPVFLIHPIELVSEIPDPRKWGRRSGNQFEYLFKEKLRTALKRRNLGDSAAHLLEGELAFFKSNLYHGKRLVDVYNEINMEHVNE